MSWIGKWEDDSEIKGTLKVPEVSHEAIDGLSEYVVGKTRQDSNIPRLNDSCSLSSLLTPHHLPAIHSSLTYVPNFHPF